MSNKIKKKKSAAKLFIACILILCLVIGIFAAANRLSAPKETVDTTEFNPNRSEIIKQYLTPITEDSISDNDNFIVTVTPVGDDNSIVNLKNCTGYFFTGDITVHDSAVISVNALAPSISENFEIPASLSATDTDYTYNGNYYEFDNTKLLPFTIEETPLGNDTFKCCLSVDTFTTEEAKDIAHYYYVLDTLYNFSATEYLLMDKSGSDSYGSLSVDPATCTVKYYQDDSLIFTESY